MVPKGELRPFNLPKVMILWQGWGTLRLKLSHLAPEPHSSPFSYAVPFSIKSGCPCAVQYYMILHNRQKRGHAPICTILFSQLPTGCVTMGSSLASISPTCHMGTLWKKHGVLKVHLYRSTSVT